MDVVVDLQCTSHKLYNCLYRTNTVVPPLIRPQLPKIIPYQSRFQRGWEHNTTYLPPSREATPLFIVEEAKRPYKKGAYCSWFWNNNLTQKINKVCEPGSQYILLTLILDSGVCPLTNVEPFQWMMLNNTPKFSCLWNNFMCMMYEANFNVVSAYEIYSGLIDLWCVMPL